MTIESIIAIVFVATFGFVFGFSCLFYAKVNYSAGAVVLGVAVIIASIAICIGMWWWQMNTESGKRAFKDQQSNLSGGIERTVTVYDINGNVIKEYSGKFDVETDRESYILFDDEDGNRHMIYYTTGTIIVDEK